MGCSSSAITKAGDSSRVRHEENKSCFAQPKPGMLGREPTVDGKIQKEGLPPLEKLKISVVSTANGVKALCEQPLEKGDGDPPGTTEKIHPLEGPTECGPPQTDSKDDIPGAAEEKDVAAVTEIQPLKANAEVEPSRMENKHQSSMVSGKRESVEDTENPEIVRELNPLGTAETIPPLESAGKPQIQEVMEKDEQSQFLQTIPRETNSPETLGERQLVETLEELERQETVGKDEQSQHLEAVPQKSESLQVLGGSQLVGTAAEKEVLENTAAGPGETRQAQSEGIAESAENPAGIPASESNADRARTINTDEKGHNIEGETGEKVETEMENEKVSEGTGTKEEETGEAVDLSAAS